MHALALTLLHLWAWAQLGILARVYLGKLFGGACGDPAWPWVPCVTSPGLQRYGGAVFTDLPANVAGSFLIGLVSSGEALGAVYGAASLTCGKAAVAVR